MFTSKKLWERTILKIGFFSIFILFGAAHPSFAADASLDATYTPRQYDVAVEGLTATPGSVEIEGMLLLTVQGKVVNRGTSTVVIKPEQLKLLPDMSEEAITFLQSAGKISEEVADILREYGDQEAFSCGDAEETDCILGPSEEKAFTLYQPSYFITKTGAIVAVVMSKAFSDSNAVSVTDENGSNNMKYVILFPPAADPDIAVQGLSADPQLDETGKLTGIKLSGYILNLSKTTLVRGFQKLTIKVNNKTQSDLDIDFDYSDASSAWKDEAIAELEEYPTAQDALEAFFAALEADTLFPAGGKAYFTVTLPTTNIKNNNIISVTAPSSYQALSIPVLDSNGDKRITTAEIRGYIEDLADLSWQAATDANTKNNKAFLYVLLSNTTIQAGEYLGTLWVMIAGMLDELGWTPGTLLPDGWTPGSYIPDDWEPGDVIPDYCVLLPDGTSYCPDVPEEWTPGAAIAILKQLAQTYEVTYIKGTLSSKIYDKLKAVQDFLKQKASLAELMSNGVTKVTKKTQNGTNAYDYTLRIWNPSKIAAGSFVVSLNVRGENERKVSVDSLGARKMKKLAFSSDTTQLAAGGNLLEIYTDEEFSVDERNEFNNDIFKEVIADKKGNILRTPQRYTHEESKFLNSFYYIAYPFVADLYDTSSSKLTTVPVQSWVINLIDTADTGEFQLKMLGVKRGVKSKEIKTLCTSKSTDAVNFASEEWARYDTVNFEFESCNLEYYKGLPVLLQLSRKAPDSSEFTVVTRRTIMVP